MSMTVQYWWNDIWKGALRASSSATLTTLNPTDWPGIESVKLYRER